jgi:hypothetical protein
VSPISATALIRINLHVCVDDWKTTQQTTIRAIEIELNMLVGIQISISFIELYFLLLLLMSQTRNWVSHVRENRVCFWFQRLFRSLHANAFFVVERDFSYDNLKTEIKKQFWVWEGTLWRGREFLCVSFECFESKQNYNQVVKWTKHRAAKNIEIRGYKEVEYQPLSLFSLFLIVTSHKFMISLSSLNTTQKNYNSRKWKQTFSISTLENDLINFNPTLPSQQPLQEYFEWLRLTS